MFIRFVNKMIMFTKESIPRIETDKNSNLFPLSRIK